MGRGGRPRDSVFARRWDADEHDQEAGGDGLPEPSESYKAGEEHRGEPQCDWTQCEPAEYRGTPECHQDGEHADDQHGQRQQSGGEEGGPAEGRDDLTISLECDPPDGAEEHKECGLEGPIE